MEKHLWKFDTSDFPDRSTVINPTFARIGDILNQTVPYTIPNYQREFKWGVEETQELIEDLESYSGKSGKNLFLGTIIFEVSSPDEIQVVDGQQRLTSILILLIACRGRADKMNELSFGQQIQNKIALLDAAGKVKGFRMATNDSIRQVFEYIGQRDWKGDFPEKLDGKSVKRQVNKIRDLYTKLPYERARPAAKPA